LKKDPASGRLRAALERFHAPAVAERRAAELARLEGGRQPLVERRNCTLLFADIAGFAELSRRLPPEGLVAILDEFHRRMSAVVFEHEGTIDRFVGNTVLALFGAPYAEGDEAQRAVRTALSMRAEWNRAMAGRAHQESCKLRVGLATGTVLAGTLGPETRLDYTVIGEPVNLASWLAASAAPGQILITAKTLAAVGSTSEVAPLGERVLRPQGEKVPVFEVVDRTLPAAV
jgi:class 3 adenylate cyclase